MIGAREEARHAGARFLSDIGLVFQDREGEGVASVRKASRSGSTVVWLRPKEAFIGLLGADGPVRFLL